MGAFEEYPSTKKLTELAKEPYDLHKEGLSVKRIDEMVADAHGLKMLYGTERVTDKVMQALRDLADEASVFEKLEAMQNGEVINKIEGHESENRMVLHTAMRDIFGSTNQSPETKSAVDLAFREMEKLKIFLEKVEKEGFTDLIQVGIGGSDLGPRAIYLALAAFKRPDRNVHFISNVDPDDAHAVLNTLDLSKTLVVVVSKSGGTLETLTNELLVKKRFKEEGLSPKEHFLAVTGTGSPMDNPDEYRESFYIWDYIGGRYSVTSMVGGVALAFSLGMEKYVDFLKGANSMDQVCHEKDLKKNLPLLGALLGIWNRNFLGCYTAAVIPYSQAMTRFAAHLQQVDMESNGKRIDKQGHPVEHNTGPVIWGEPGTNGQHSFYQCIHQGSSIIPVEFLGFRDTQFSDDIEVQGTCSQEKLLSNLFAQSISLACGQASDNPNKVFPGNRPNRLILAEQCEPFTLGAILSYFENKVAFQGFIWNINSFDQEGVQLGKLLANKIIDIYSKKRKGEETDGKAFPEGEALIRHIESI
jgi:glucose-6-phosphate isomerase